MTDITSKRKTRISAKVKTAIDLIVFDGQKRDQAADAVGLHRDSLRKAFKRPDVLAYLREQKQVLREGAGAQTIAVAERLMHESASDHVRLDAAKWIADVNGDGPVHRGEVTHRYEGTVPGLRIIFTSPEPSDAAMVDVTPAPRARIEQAGEGFVIGTPVEHPALVKREESGK